MLKEIGARIKLLRDREPQRDFAARCGVDVTSYGFYERGDRAPSLDFILQLGKATGTSLEWVLTGRGAPQNKGSIDARKLAMAIRLVREERPGLSVDQEIAAAIAIYEALVQNSADETAQPEAIRKGA